MKATQKVKVTMTRPKTKKAQVNSQNLSKNIFTVFPDLSETRNIMQCTKQLGKTVECCWWQVFWTTATGSENDEESQSGESDSGDSSEGGGSEDDGDYAYADSDDNDDNRADINNVETAVAKPTKKDSSKKEKPTKKVTKEATSDSSSSDENSERTPKCPICLHRLKNRMVIK